MFIEQNLTGERRGWIEVVCGSMFSGKTEELIRRLKRAKIAHLKVECHVVRTVLGLRSGRGCGSAHHVACRVASRGAREFETTAGHRKRS